MLFEPGQVVEGKYRIARLIGHGGMGAIYEGENVLIRRRVAIKVLHADSSTNADVIRRFEREAQAAGEIGSDHILEVLDLGSLANGDRYMVMEYLDGETLATRIERLGRLTPTQLAPIARQFLTALICAHAAGIIHRDLKPENIFILRSKAGLVDFVKLIDFGISKFSRPFKEGEHRMTRANAVLGTPCYMSPEQARGASETDVRSDIYSCGVILYEAVSGRLPFEGESFNDLMFKIALSDPPPLLSLLPALDPEFAALVTRAIARDPAERFPTAQQFADALDEWMEKNVPAEALLPSMPSGSFRARMISTSPTLATTLPPPASAPALEKMGTDESWARSGAEPTNRRKRGMFVAGGSATAVALCVGIALFVRADPTPKTSRARAVAPVDSSAPGPPPTSAPAESIAALPLAVPSVDPVTSSRPTDTTTGTASSIPKRHDAGPKGAHGLHTTHPATPAPLVKEQAKPAPGTRANGFDLGY